jgi:hypothetical protein
MAQYHLPAARHGIAMRSDKNPIAEKYNTLVMRVYFRDRVERDWLAQELNAEEVQRGRKTT